MESSGFSYVLALPFAGLLLFSLYVKSPSCASYYLRFTTFGLIIALWSFLSLPLHIWKGRTHDCPQMGKMIVYLAELLLGLKWKVVNTIQELESFKSLMRVHGGGVIVVNHQSGLDVLAVLELWHVLGKLTVVSKKALLYWGPLGLDLYYSGTTFIDRKKSSESLSALSTAVLSGKADCVPMLIFPEGRRHHRRFMPELLPFRKGGFVAAIDGQVPVFPTVISHYGNLDGQAKVLLPKVSTIRVLDPISTEGLTMDDLPDLTRKTRDRMQGYFRSTVES